MTGRPTVYKKSNLNDNGLVRRRRRCVLRRPRDHEGAGLQEGRHGRRLLRVVLLEHGRRPAVVLEVGELRVVVFFREWVVLPPRGVWMVIMIVVFGVVVLLLVMVVVIVVVAVVVLIVVLVVVGMIMQDWSKVETKIPEPGFIGVKGHGVGVMVAASVVANVKEAYVEVVEVEVIEEALKVAVELRARDGAGEVVHAGDVGAVVDGGLQVAPLDRRGHVYVNRGRTVDR